MFLFNSSSATVRRVRIARRPERGVGYTTSVNGYGAPFSSDGISFQCDSRLFNGQSRLPARRQRTPCAAHSHRSLSAFSSREIIILTLLSEISILGYRTP